MMKYLDYWSMKFRDMSNRDIRVLGIPVLGFPFWIVYGIIMPNIIIPIDWLKDFIKKG